MSAATAVKSAGIAPGLVVAPTLENPSGAAVDAWMDWSQPVDVLSFNLYTTDVVAALAKIDEMNAWCGANRRCPRLLHHRIRLTLDRSAARSAAIETRP